MIRTPFSSHSDGAVRIREVTLDDAEDLYRWRMAPRTQHNFLSTEPVPYEDHLRFLRHYFRPENTDWWFVIEVDGEPVCTFALYHFSATGEEAEFGRFSVNPTRRLRWGRDRSLSVRAGFIRAVTLLKIFARENNMYRWYAVILSTNSPALKLAHDVGFVAEEKVEITGREFIIWRLALRPPHEP